MIEQVIRAHYQKIIVDPVAIKLKNHISPNLITWVSGILGVLVVPALLFHHVFLAIGLLLLSGYCDTLDGTLARFKCDSSDWGSVLDIMMDRLVEFFVVFALWAVDPVHRALWCFLMLGSMLFCITSFLVVGIFIANQEPRSKLRDMGNQWRPSPPHPASPPRGEGDKEPAASCGVLVNESHKGFHYSPGMMERAEAFLFFIAMMLWPKFFVVLAILFILLVTLTAVIRLRQFYVSTTRFEK